ncbi:MAG: lysoplasmalogenase, partial [Helicobacteraceae bacterium]|nr:lysoplasmalogenase [Helicobacteraceae bacterium]
EHHFTSPTYFLCILGYLMFVLSDSLLLRGELIKTDYRANQTMVMGTYITAQLLILVSMAIDPHQENHLKQE